jgi:hypothetical protein
MVDTLKKILEGVLDRLSYHLTTYVPSILAALIIVLGAFVLAKLVRWLLYKIFKGPAIDKFLRQTGVAFMLDSSGHLRATTLVGETVYWGILLSGLLVGLSALNTDVTTQIVESFVLMLPKLAIAGLILVAGAWLSQYLCRSTLVWSVNEGLPTPRRLALAVRIVVMFVAIVVAADQLDFARSVFLAAFVILVGGAVLTASLAIGIGASGGVRRWLQGKREELHESNEESVLSHV